jgi:hypothetical protein
VGADAGCSGLRSQDRPERASHWNSIWPFQPRTVHARAGYCSYQNRTRAVEVLARNNQAIAKIFSHGIFTDEINLPR